MGSCSSIANSIPTRKIDEANSFYWACRNGDIATVQKILPNLTYKQVNQIELDGNTALHAACFYNQPRIVELLLSSGCSRTTTNYQGATAYQEATSGEIRALFNRTTSNRFIDEHLTDSFRLLTCNGDKVKMKDCIPDDWIKKRASADSTHAAKFMIAMANSVGTLEQIVNSRTGADITRNLSKLVSTALPKNHIEYKNMTELYKKFSNKMGIGYLLTMYTLETPLYTVLQNEVDSFTVLLYSHLNELQDRAYQGQAYRGGDMAENDINAYRWALEREGYVLETRTLQSMSRNKSVAQELAKVKQSNNCVDRYSALLILDFPEECPTAINLTKISEAIPALSAFEHEEEVLLLPFTLFTVKELKIDSESGQYYITLVNVPTPKSSLLDAIKHMKS